MQGSLRNPARALPALLLAAWCCVAGATAPEIRILDTDPDPGTSLYRNEALYVRLEYRSDTPLRFSLRAYTRGSPMERVFTNPSPVYPAGTGEAIVWLEPQHPGYLDEIEIRISDTEWNPVASRKQPLTLFRENAARTSTRVRAGWVDVLIADQQKRVTNVPATAVGSTVGWGLLLMLMGWSVPGYLILQVYMGRRYRDGWRRAALAPLLAMIPLFAYTLIALAMGSNLWPLMLLFLAPVAFVYLVVLGILHRLRAQ